MVGQMLPIIMTAKDKFWGKDEEAWGAPLDVVTKTLEEGSFVSLDRKYLYVENPKAASTKIKKMIFDLEQFPISSRPKKFSRVSRREMYIHHRDAAKMPSLHSLITADDSFQFPSDFFIFTAVRNPFSRILSAWINKLMIPEPGYFDLHQLLMKYETDAGGRPTFKAFCRYLLEQGRESLKQSNKHWRLQKYVVYPHIIKYSHIAKITELEQLVNQWNRHLEFPFSESEIKNRLLLISNSSRIFYDQNYFDAESKEIISELYEEDFRFFNFDDQLPDQLRNPSPISNEERFWAYKEEIRLRNEVIFDLYRELESNPK